MLLYHLKPTYEQSSEYQTKITDNQYNTLLLAGEKRKQNPFVFPVQRQQQHHEPTLYQLSQRVWVYVC